MMTHLSLIHTLRIKYSFITIRNNLISWVWMVKSLCAGKTHWSVNLQSCKKKMWNLVISFSWNCALVGRTLQFWEKTYHFNPFLTKIMQNVYKNHHFWLDTNVDHIPGKLAFCPALILIPVFILHETLASLINKVEIVLRSYYYIIDC